jgi:hypothetical protein
LKKLAPSSGQNCQLVRRQLLTPGGWVLVVFGPEAVFFFSGKSSPNFNLKNYDFDISKGFFMEKMVQIRQIVPNCEIKL